MRFFINTMEVVRFKDLGWGPYEGQSSREVAETKWTDLRRLAETEVRAIKSKGKKDLDSTSPEFAAIVTKHLEEDLVPAFLAALTEGQHPKWYFGDVPNPSSKKPKVRLS